MTITTNFLPFLADAAIGTPITRAGVSLFPVYFPGRTAGGPIIATGPGAPVVIKERPTATVPTLVAENPGDAPVLLVDGQTVVGGNQNRVLNVSVLVPRHGEIEVPVSCVEQGRWRASDQFRQSSTFATRRVRRATSYSVSANIVAGRDKMSDQGLVWRTVAHELDRLDVRHDSGAFNAAEERLDPHAARHEFHRLVAEAAAELSARGPLPGQCGVVVSHGSRVVSLEWFATPEMLAAHWPALVNGAVLDAPERLPSSRPSASRALQFLRRAAQHSATVSPGVGLGSEHHLRTSKVVGQALVLDDLVVHAAAFALAA
jgi:hypothetical protein